MQTHPLHGLLSLPPPELTDVQTAQLLADHFGIAGRMKRLTSERDLNIHVATPRQDYVLKLANRGEPPEVTDFQTKALLHLAATDLPVPRVIRTHGGTTHAETAHGTLRLLTYLHGTPLHATTRSPQQAAAMAQIAARLSLALQGFAHPAADHILQWDIRHASALRPLLSAIPDDLRVLATATLNRFDTEVASHLPGLRWQVVHNDLNPHNVLTDPADPGKIAGVLDFGDMVRTPLVCDAAIAASYHIDAAQPLNSLQTFARAYHDILPLTALEAQLFPDLVATRMLTTLAITSSRAARYPENAPYILRNFATSANGLRALAAIPRATIQTAMECL